MCRNPHQCEIELNKQLSQIEPHLVVEAAGTHAEFKGIVEVTCMNFSFRKTISSTIYV